MGKTIMISMPMGIDISWKLKYFKVAYQLEKEGYNVMPLYYDQIIHGNMPELKYPVKREPLVSAGYSLIQLSMCDAIYFCLGWESARGCRIEHAAAVYYGVEIIYEK